MGTATLTATLTALLVVVALAAANRNQFRRVSVKIAFNRTICPFKMVTDYDPTRVPSRIRTTQCADQPLELCSSGQIPFTDCCNHYSGSSYFSCVELRETVLVRYKDRLDYGMLDVAVGCACRIGMSHDAAELPSGPERRLALGLLPAT